MLKKSLFFFISVTMASFYLTPLMSQQQEPDPIIYFESIPQDEKMRFELVDKNATLIYNDTNTPLRVFKVICDLTSVESSSNDFSKIPDPKFLMKVFQRWVEGDIGWKMENDSTALAQIKNNAIHIVEESDIQPHQFIAIPRQTNESLSKSNIMRIAYIITNNSDYIILRKNNDIPIFYSLIRRFCSVCGLCSARRLKNNSKKLSNSKQYCQCICKICKHRENTCLCKNKLISFSSSFDRETIYGYFDKEKICRYRSKPL